MSTDNLDFLSGEVTDDLQYTPVPQAKFRAQIIATELTDPRTLGWLSAPLEHITGETDEDYARREQFRSAPFERVRWKLLGTPDGSGSIYTGRIVDQRVGFLPGTNPKTGRSNLLPLADLLRLKHGLSANAEVVGLKLFDTSDLKALRESDHAAFLQEFSRRFAEAVVGLEGIVRVGHRQTDDGPVDQVVKIVLPK